MHIKRNISYANYLIINSGDLLIFVSSGFPNGTTFKKRGRTISSKPKWPRSVLDTEQSMKALTCKWGLTSWDVRLEIAPLPVLIPVAEVLPLHAVLVQGLVQTVPELRKATVLHLVTHLFPLDALVLLGALHPLQDIVSVTCCMGTKGYNVSWEPEGRYQYSKMFR